MRATPDETEKIFLLDDLGSYHSLLEAFDSLGEFLRSTFGYLGFRKQTRGLDPQFINLPT
jgi:hypothetical protein